MRIRTFYRTIYDVEQIADMYSTTLDRRKLA